MQHAGKKKLYKPTDLLGATLSANSGTVVYVSLTGNNDTGQRGNISKPFLTPAAGVTACNSGDTLCFFAGEYECTTNLYKSGIRYTTIGRVKITKTNNDSNAMFTVNNPTLDFVLDGSFILVASNNTATAGVFKFYGSPSANLNYFIRIVNATNGDGPVGSFVSDINSTKLTFYGDCKTNALLLGMNANIYGSFFACTISTSLSACNINIYGHVDTLTNSNDGGGLTSITGSYTTLSGTSPINVNGGEYNVIKDVTENYTLLLTDRTKLLRADNAGATIEITVPPHSSVAFRKTEKIRVMWYGIAQVEFIADTGVTINSAGGALKIAEQFGQAILENMDGADEWNLTGGITV